MKYSFALAKGKRWKGIFNTNENHVFKSKPYVFKFFVSLSSVDVNSLVSLFPASR